MARDLSHFRGRTDHLLAADFVDGIRSVAGLNHAYPPRYDAVPTTRLP